MVGWRMKVRDECLQVRCHDVAALRRGAMWHGGRV